MARTVQDAINALQTLALSLDGIRAAPHYVPDALNVFPCVITYAHDGELLLQGACETQDMHHVYCEIHVARKHLAHDLQSLMPYVEKFRQLLASNPTLDGTVDTILYPVRYTIMHVEWAPGQMTLALRFMITVKQRNEV